jgi:hypothetical protein
MCRLDRISFGYRVFDDTFRCVLDVIEGEESMSGICDVRSIGRSYKISSSSSLTRTLYLSRRLYGSSYISPEK